MQPGPGRNTGTGWSGKKKAPGGGKPVVDPRPGDARDIGVNPPAKRRIVVDPAPGKKVPNPGLGAKPKPRTGRVVPNPGLGVDDRIYRTMPITEKQLGSIKKMYGIK